MTFFERPAVWIAALPWVALCLWLAWTQAGALEEARRLVSARFLTRVTRYSRLSLGLHMAALCAIGLGLLVVVAEPVSRRRPAPPIGDGRLLCLFDGSASMYATDVEPYHPRPGAAPGRDPTRFDVARAICRDLVVRLDDTLFGIASFSGISTLHLPFTADRELVEHGLAMLEPHTVFQNGGSSLAVALETVFRYTGGPDSAGEGAAGLQVVLLGDGELPFEESYAEPLAALAELGVPVHAVTIGSDAGQTRLIYDPRDLAAGAEEKKVLLEYTTRRVDRHYRELAEVTGGSFLGAEPGVASELARRIRAHRRAMRAIEQPPLLEPHRWLVIAALAGCVVHLLFLTPLRRRSGPSFDLERLGPAPSAGGSPPIGAVWLLALLPLVFQACADGPRARAHRANERGLALDDLGQSAAARAQFELSASYGFRPEIPIHNLARSLARRDSFTEAHRLFQRALELEPGLVDAVFNDGVTLYEWGRAERDPRDCQLERTLELWRGARSRFASMTEGVVERDVVAARAAGNLARVDDEIAEVEGLLADPPEHCRAAGGGGEQEEQDQDQEQEEGHGQEPEPGEADEKDSGGGAAAPPPQMQPSSGPLTEAERRRIGLELDRIANQVTGEGRFYRRTRSEQYAREDWSEPSATIWW